jgi:hypothetical protein
MQESRHILRLPSWGAARMDGLQILGGRRAERSTHLDRRAKPGCDGEEVEHRQIPKHPEQSVEKRFSWQVPTVDRTPI